ncbi:hypothetical protein D3C78_1831320 [compost metagenome]
MSDSGKPPNTEALQTSPSRSACMARSMMSFMGCMEGVWRSMCVSIGRRRHSTTGWLRFSSSARMLRPTRAPVS